MTLHEKFALLLAGIVLVVISFITAGTADFIGLENDLGLPQTAFIVGIIAIVGSIIWIILDR